MFVNYIDAMISCGESGMVTMEELIYYCDTKKTKNLNSFSNKITDCFTVEVS